MIVLLHIVNYINFFLHFYSCRIVVIVW